MNNSHKDIILQNSFLLENIQGGIVYSDSEPPFHLRYATEGMAKLSGYTPDELVTMKQMDLVHDDDVQKLLDDVGAQFAVGDTFSVEYRLKRKDGTYVYVLDRAKMVPHNNGGKYIHCLLTDISELKLMERQLRLNEEKYKIATLQSGNVIIEYNILTGAISFSDNYKQLFGDCAPTGTLKEIIAAGWTDKDYSNKLIKLFDRVVKTATTRSMELILHTEQTKHIWCSLYLIPIIDNGHLYSVVGCLENINDAKNRIKRLTKLSTTDSLTGIYNRYAVEKFVSSKIIESNNLDKTALIILDIDYFKNVNDTHGHEQGDNVLIKLAKTVNNLLPSDTIFGRLGGDEFLIFTNLSNNQMDIDDLAEKIVMGVQDEFEEDTIPITISMGIALHTEELNTFKDLYKKADIALYYTKKNVRNGYTINRD